MKQVIAVLVFCIPLVIKAQNDTSANGIRFENGLSWQEIKDKARLENKYIFVDCYATWCGPCKGMDQDVYPSPAVGNYMNDKFISVKFQLDTTKRDNDEVKSSYADAHSLQQQFQIYNLPTFLFFSPKGKILHRGLGGMTADDFIGLAKNALNPAKQFYTLLENYQEGAREYSSIPYLANTAKLITQEELSNAIAKDYIDGYLMKLHEEKFFVKSNLEFIESYSEIIHSKDKVFKVFYKNADKINKIEGRVNFAQSVVMDVITREEDIHPLKNFDKDSTEPNWSRISKMIKSKYNSEYADRIVVNAKLSWYLKKNNWTEYTKCIIHSIETYGVDTSNFTGDFLINNNAWGAIFLHSTDHEQINIGIKWMEGVIRRSQPPLATQHDTYANLLYKAGRNKEAIVWEEKAKKLEEEDALRTKRPPDDSYEETLEKMRKGIPTWPQR